MTEMVCAESIGAAAILVAAIAVGFGGTTIAAASYLVMCLIMTLLSLVVDQLQ